MPIKIPDNLPARKFLEEEGLMVMQAKDAVRQDIRPLRIALLNLMPLKEKTELQIARLLGASPLQVELTLLRTGSYVATHVAEQHLLDFYRPWAEVADQKFDGLIITGAPIEKLPYESVAYWQELQAIFAWSYSNVFNSFNICWGAQAALYHFHGVNKYLLDEKKFGLYQHRVTRPASSLLRGFDDVFWIPVSRYTEVRETDIPAKSGLNILANSDQAGLCLIRDNINHQVYMFNHLEYDALTLAEEYQRDREKGLAIAPPKNYFPEDNPTLAPQNNWRAHAHLLVSNWLNDVYQGTAYKLEEIGQDR